VVSHCNDKRLNKRLTDIASKSTLSQANIDELELINRQLTKILLQADNQCRPLSMAPWSPEVQTAYLAHRYWSIKLTAKRTECKFDSALQQLATRMDPTLTTKDPLWTISSHL